MATGTFDEMDLEPPADRASGKEPLPPPWRQVGGAPVEGVFESLIDKGLPASCPTHGAWPFVWRSTTQGFYCPRDTWGDRCGSWVPYEDVIASSDGGEVANDDR
jgi:hypothetical protein